LVGRDYTRLIKGDREEETFLAVLGFLAAVGVVGGGLVYLGHRRIMALKRMSTMVDDVKKLQGEGKWKEAGELLRHCESLAASSGLKIKVT
jgi:hypothetical protein